MNFEDFKGPYTATTIPIIPPAYKRYVPISIVSIPNRFIGIMPSIKGVSVPKIFTIQSTLSITSAQPY